jgi:hypothetical protein
MSAFVDTMGDLGQSDNKDVRKKLPFGWIFFSKNKRNACDKLQ